MSPKLKTNENNIKYPGKLPLLILEEQTGSKSFPKNDGNEAAFARAAVV